MVNENLKEVLVIDDDADIRFLTKHFLEEEGYRVSLAENGLAGLRILKSIGRPHAVIVDMMMPYMNGEDFIDCLRKNSEYADVPIVVVSASATEQQTRGANAVVKKPILINDLLDTVRAAAKG